ncbi:MAG: hypothetical protein KAS65_05810, partial [Candidatus Aminicenantes bacterium]|nr:hypothetical protein [Candidatus Aminicenantes bacterium]
AAGETLPPLLNLSTGGVLSGIATTPGSFNFSVNVYDGTTDPLNPPQGTVTVNVSEQPAVNNIITILRARQGGWPWIAGDPPLNEINLALTDNVKIDFSINDISWENIWRNELPAREARLYLVGLCNYNIGADSFRVNSDGDYVAVYLLSDFIQLVNNAGGIDNSPFIFKLELRNGETTIHAFSRRGNIVVVNEP